MLTANLPPVVSPRITEIRVINIVFSFYLMANGISVFSCNVMNKIDEIEGCGTKE